jgi:hypothetical protein
MFAVVLPSRIHPPGIKRDAERLPELRENDNDTTIGKNALGENIAHEKQELK